MPTKSKKRSREKTEKRVVPARIPNANQRRVTRLSRRASDGEDNAAGVKFSFSLSDGTVERLSRIAILLLLLAAFLYAPNAAALLTSLKAAVELLKHFR